MAAVKRTLTRETSKAAYTLVDLSDLHPETRKDIIRDAYEGAGLYGVRVVEESVNGGARAPIFGVYNDGEDAERWTAAKKELKLGSSEVDDDTVITGDVDVNDPRREAAIREAAAQAANAEADAIRAGEAEAIASIVGDDADAGDERQPPNRSAQRTGATDGHPTNIVDATLSEDAENRVEDLDTRKTTKKNKAPK